MLIILFTELDLAVRLGIIFSIQKKPRHNLQEYNMPNFNPAVNILKLKIATTIFHIPHS